MKKIILLLFLVVSIAAKCQVPYASEYPVQRNDNWRFKSGDTVTFNQITVQDKGRWLPNGQIDYIAGVGPYTWPTSITTGTKVFTIDGATKVISFTDYAGVGLGDGSFLGLDDTPDDYSGNANKLVFVTADEDSLTFTNRLQWSAMGLTDALLIQSDDVNSGIYHFSADFSKYSVFNYNNIGLTDGTNTLNLFPNRIEPPNIRWNGGDSYLNWSLGETIAAADGPVNWYWHPFLNGAGAILADSLGDGHLRLMKVTDLFSEVDGSISNEGSLTVLAGTGATSIISSNTSGSTSVTIQGGTGIGMTELGNTIGITNTGDTNAGDDLTTSTTFGGDVSGTYNAITVTDDSHSHSSTTISTNIVSSVDGVANDGGDIDLVAGGSTTITPDDGANTITISSSYKTIIGSMPVSSVPASSTGYAPIFSQNNFSTTESQRQMIMPFAGTASNLYVVMTGNQPASGSMVVTVRKNGSATTLTLTIAANATAATFSDTSNSFTFSAGDKISLQFVNNATGNSGAISSAAFMVQ